MSEGDEEVKLVNLGLPDQLVYNSMEVVGLGEEQVLLTIARLPNEKNYSLFFVSWTVSFYKGE
jgi:hypothetical protein